MINIHIHVMSDGESSLGKKDNRIKVHRITQQRMRANATSNRLLKKDLSAKMIFEKRSKYTERDLISERREFPPEKMLWWFGRIKQSKINFSDIIWEACGNGLLFF